MRTKVAYLLLLFQRSSLGRARVVANAISGEYVCVLCVLCVSMAIGYFKGKNGQPKNYSMVIPPPNVTGTLHIGHTLTVAIQVRA
jgi:hypothetical protein